MSLRKDTDQIPASRRDARHPRQLRQSHRNPEALDHGHVASALARSPALAASSIKSATQSKTSGIESRATACSVATGLFSNAENWNQIRPSDDKFVGVRASLRSAANQLICLQCWRALQKN